MTKIVKLTLHIVLLSLLTISLLLPSIYSPSAKAVSGSDWKPGRIIDDGVFYNKSSMTPTEIYQFLKVKVGACDRNRLSSNPDYQPPWTCLFEYKENIVTKENNYGKFNADGTPKNIDGGKTAARIIWEVAQQYGINPQVLIVMLQKEQSLISDNWPWKIQYDRAMGYACPDSGPDYTANCDSNYYGFYNQVDAAAWQLKRYIQYPDNYNFKAGVTRYIQYNPNPSCGGSNVYIDNPATAALYNYTPYQPNLGSLNNLYGTAYCGAYGNRNFWRMFNDWFGSPYVKIDYSDLNQKRYMQTNKDLKKINLRTGLEIGDTISSGAQIFFPTKVEIGGVWYLRTEHDTKKGLDRGIKLEDVDDIELSFEPMNVPRWLELKSDYRKINPLTKEVVYGTLPMGTKIYFSEKTEIGGKLFLRTLFDDEKEIIAGIESEQLNDFTPEYTEMSLPRWFNIDNEKTYSYDYRGKALVDPNPTGLVGQKYYKTQINDVLYLRETLPSSDTDNLGLRYSDLKEIQYEFNDLIKSRYMQTNKDLKKINLRTGLEIGDTISSGAQIFFPTKVEIGGVWYLRTEHDTKKGLDRGIKLEDVDDIELSFEPMNVPRSLTTIEEVFKIEPLTKKQTYGPIPNNTSISFNEKVSVGGKLFLRTKNDANKGFEYVIPYESLE